MKQAQEALNADYWGHLFPNSPYDFHPYSESPNYPLNLDGISGIDTEHATMDFQKVAHLTVDGIIGPKTWHDLYAIYC